MTEVDINETDLLAEFKMCYVLRTLHIASEERHYKVRYCVKREKNNAKLMLIVTALVNGTTLRETLNELIKCAELGNNYYFLLYSSVFIFRHYLFIEYQTVAYDLEQILRVKRKYVKNDNGELIASVLTENVIGHILRKILKALSYLHQYALHNNLVTRSIVVTKNCDIKLTGFKWTVLKNEDIRKALSLRNNRFFGRPTQWAPEEALNNIAHYGSHTELWHIGLLIPEMITGETFHLTDTTRSGDVRQYAEQLMQFQVPVPYHEWFPNGMKFPLSLEILRLWHCLMQPNHEKRPTIDELLEQNIFKIIKSIDKSEIREVLLDDSKKYRLSFDEQAEPLQKWSQLVNYSRERGANDITRLESLYLGMGRNEFFSSVNHKNEIDDDNPMYRIDFRKVPNDLLQCVCIGILKNRKRRAGLALTIHLDINTIDMCTIVCRYVYKFVQSDIIGFINYVRISLEIIDVLKQREQTRAKHKSWQIYLEKDEINKAEIIAQVQVIFDGITARNTLENAEKGNFKFTNFNMIDSPILEIFAPMRNITNDAKIHRNN
ncbi:Serine/threonine-protein kinase [Dirofilaria immitis]